MEFEINNFRIEAENYTDALSFWRNNIQTDDCKYFLNGQAQAFKRYGTIYVTFNSWQTYFDIVYLDKEMQEKIKSLFTN